jgi:hypothetical protein
MQSHLLPREKHGNLRKKIDELGPFQIITQDNFVSDIVNNSNNKHKMLGKELQCSDKQVGCTAQLVDIFEKMLKIKTQWQ